MTRKILIAILLCLPVATWASVDTDIAQMNAANELADLERATDAAFNNLSKDDKYKNLKNKDDIISEYRGSLKSGSSSSGDDSDSSDDDNDSDSESSKDEDKSENKSTFDQDKIDKAQEAYDKAKENEQSLENRMLGGLTTLATGIGGMQLAQGLAEKNADADADKDMDAYIETMRCSYGEGNSVKFSTDPVELPGGNNPELLKYRSEYIALAADLKERKTALDMKPGIEAEEILDKASSGLYDDVNTGITGGTYASRYRAVVGNEKDKKALAAAKKEAKTRMIAGGVIAGVGFAGGMIANSLMNGKLGELIKERKNKKVSAEDNKKAIRKLKDKARGAHAKDPEYIDKMDLEDINIGAYLDIIDDINFKNLKDKKIEDLCPSLSEDTLDECAENILTEKSREKLSDALNDSGSSKSPSGVSSLLQNKDLLGKGAQLLSGNGGEETE